MGKQSQSQVRFLRGASFSERKDSNGDDTTANVDILILMQAIAAAEKNSKLFVFN